MHAGKGLFLLSDNYFMESNTICAISTAPGVGGIAVIRVSGPDAISYTDRIFKSVKQNFSLKEAKGQSLVYGDICNEDGSILDNVLVSVFRNPHSFTGEDTTEISCHGSLYIQQQILQMLLSVGCRMALPGEFTQRAFLNGKMDLSQAEAVADLIASTTTVSHKIAMNQMRGGFSNELVYLREKLLTFVSLIELELDFSTEDVEFADRTELNDLVADIKGRISSLCKSFSIGNAIKNGIPVAIVGQTNVGKSTLLNCLLNEDKAIVSDVRGTTRDVIEDTFVHGGVQFRLIDTAGIRETADVVEKLGIERSFKKMDEANIVLLVCDSTENVDEIQGFIEDSLARLKDKDVVVLFNKCDLISAEQKERLEKITLAGDVKVLFLSAMLKQNTDALLDVMLELSRVADADQDSVIVASMRHFEALKKALAAIDRVDMGLLSQLPTDLLTRDIHDCIDALGEITGQISSQDVLNNIFSKFCIGK